MTALRLLVALHVLELAVGAATAGATTLVALRTEAIAGGADRAVLGRVIASEARWVGRRIVTRVLLRPDGSAADLWFQHAGGTVDGVTMLVVGMPAFRPGERALVLLARRAGGLRLVGLSAGKLAVIERGGRPAVLMRLVDGGPLEPLAVADAQAVLAHAIERARGLPGSDAPAVGRFDTCGEPSP